MFDIGFSEIVVIAVVALIVIGPERLPKAARTMGHLFGRLQRYVNDVKADINREMELDELRKLQERGADRGRRHQVVGRRRGARTSRPASRASRASSTPAPRSPAATDGERPPAALEPRPIASDAAAAAAPATPRRAETAAAAVAARLRQDLSGSR